MGEQIEYIFCIGTGRNGSEYLRGIFSHVSDCVAEHEPVPRCNKNAMRQYLNGKPAAMRRLMPQKLEQIRRSKGDKRVYVETNHCFIKGFGWLIPEFIDPAKVAVIVLKRDKERIASSYLRIGSTCLSENGRNWQIVPVRRAPLVPPPKRFLGVWLSYYLWRLLALPFRHKKFYKQLRLPRPSRVPAFIRDYERECLEWYVEETDALCEKFRSTYPDIRYVAVEIQDLNDPEKVTAMFESLGLTAQVSLEESVGVPTNLKR